MYERMYTCFAQFAAVVAREGEWASNTETPPDSPLAPRPRRRLKNPIVLPSEPVRGGTRVLVRVSSMCRANALPRRVRDRGGGLGIPVGQWTSSPRAAA